MRSDRRWAVWVGLLGLCVLVMVGRMMVGASGWGWPSGADRWEQQIRISRAERVALASLVGVALSLSGVALQALLRNPLAEPYILGLSTGAGAGVMVQAAIGFQLGLMVGPTYLGAAAGSVVAMSLVYLIAQKRGVLDPVGLLLAGVVLATIGGALIMAANALAGPGGLRDFLVEWMMGELNEGEGASVIWMVAALVLAGGAWLGWRGSALDVASLSPAEAASLGVDVHRLRLALFLWASVLAAGGVVLAGPIAFVGLIAPHLGRLLVGPGHRGLVPAAMLIGAGLVVGADLASTLLDRWIDRAGRLPIGVFTALIGGPAFLWLLRPSLGRGEG